MVMRAGPGKAAIQWVLLGFILLGLGGWGVHNFSGPGRAVVARVGQTEVTSDDYARGLRSQMQALQAQTGQPVSAETARQMGLPQAVRQRLITAAALEDEAHAIGLSVGDARVAEEITKAPGFQGPTGFDRARYQQVLQQEGLSEADFEADVRMDEARLMIQRAVAGGVAAPPAQVAAITGWLTETRDIAWTELGPDALATPLPAPDDATLTAWHKDHADRFTAPEVRQIEYAWLTPEMLEGSVKLDDAALRQLYDERRAEFQKPARRLVDRLVYPDAAAAAAAKARLDAGQASFDDLVTERGLARADIELGEKTEAELGAAGKAVFAAPDTGVVGPVETELGPALISVNAILEPVDVPFEAARADLAAEAAADKARRDIEAQAAGIADLLAGGASLAQLAKETPMQTGTIDWRAADTPAQGSIAAYPAFRERAAALTEKDFPELHELGDGGLFAARLVKVTPPAVIPFAEARAAVLADWTAAETTARLEAQARAALDAGTPLAQRAAALGRDGAADGLPPAAVTRAFGLAPGAGAVVTEGGRVFALRTEAVHPADPASPDLATVRGAVERSLAGSLAEDLFDAYARALTAERGLHLSPEVAAAVEARMQ